MFLQRRTNEIVHRGHQCIVKTKQILRTNVLFPNFHSRIEKHNESCVACQAVIPRKRDSVIYSKIPEQPSSILMWTKHVPNRKQVFVRWTLEISHGRNNAFHMFFFLDANIRQNILYIWHTKINQIDNGPPFTGRNLAEFLAKYVLEIYSNLQEIRQNSPFAKVNNFLPM